MTIVHGRVVRGISRAIGGLSVLTLAPLLVWDASPRRFPERAHDSLAAVPLALIAAACLIHQVTRRAARRDLVKAILLAAAFLFWAANQFWSEHPLATLFNDVAIALFVLDASLAIVG